MRRFNGFELHTAVFASVWLMFLIPTLLQVLTGSNASPTDKAWTTACIAIFAVFYFFAFGSVAHVPCTRNALPRVFARWGVLLGITLASVPALGASAMIFTPYLAAMLGFNLPLKTALPTVVATGVIGATAVWIWDPNSLDWVAIFVIAISLVLVPLGAFSQHEDSLRDLQHQLELSQQREDIATDVHDLLGHSLTVINLKSEVARRKLKTNPEQTQQELEEISEISRSALAEVRSTVTRMRTPTFSGELQAARRALETKGITAHFPESLSKPGAHANLFSWALRELVTNVVRHSGASACWVAVTNNKLQVTDDGFGFNYSATEETIGGLAGLRGRVEAAGGQLIAKREAELTMVLVTMNGDHKLLDARPTAKETPR